MPINTVNIFRVDAVQTARPGCVSYLVTTTNGIQFYTLNTLYASLCERARAVGTTVSLSWKDGRRQTRDIVHVTLETPS